MFQHMIYMRTIVMDLEFSFDMYVMVSRALSVISNIQIVNPRLTITRSRSIC